MYKIQINQKDYVLRLSNPDRTIEDRKREVTCLKLAAQRGLAPNYLYVNVDDGVIIFQYLEKQPLTHVKIEDARTHVELAKMLRTLHSGPEFPKFISVFEIIKLYVIKALGDSKPAIVDEVLNHMQVVEAVIQRHPMSAPCHNDLNRGNILYDGNRFWFVDWEAAGQGDPYVDLAAIANWFALQPEQENLFLQAYFEQTPTDIQRARFYVMKQASLAFYGTAFLVIAKMKGVDISVQPPEQELPSLKQFLTGIRTGNVSMGDPDVLHRLAHVFLRQLLQNAATPEFQKDLKVLTNVPKNN